MIEIINKPLLLHLVGYLYYCQMGFNSVFKGLSHTRSKIHSNFALNFLFLTEPFSGYNPHMHVLISLTFSSTLEECGRYQIIAAVSMNEHCCRVVCGAV